jgi:hypothetical protein
MKVLFLVAVLFQIVSFSIAPELFSQSMEYDTDRPGMDYKNFDLPSPDPNLCINACTGDPQCKAFTYVKPGIQGPEARCWLKSGVPASVNSPCCVSGVKASKEGATPIQLPGPQASPPNIIGDKFPVGTSWNVGAYERGIKKQPHKVPWIFHDDGVVEAPGIWEGQWTLIPEGYLVTIQLFATAMGGSGSVVSGDHFLVKFSDDRKEFTAYKFENGKKGLRYRYGKRLSP